jgi:hypothetical protein
LVENGGPWRSAVMQNYRANVRHDIEMAGGRAYQNQAVA